MNATNKTTANAEFDMGFSAENAASAESAGVRSEGVEAPVAAADEAQPTPNAGIIDKTPPQRYVDVSRIAKLLCEDGGFQLRRKELVAIEDFLRHQNSLLKQLEEWSHDQARKRYNETFQLGRPSFEETLERARDARAQIKTRIRQGNKAFAVQALPIFQRAEQCGQVCVDLIEENEKSRSEWLGIHHEPSNVLRAARLGLQVLTRLVQSAREAADPNRVAMCDSTGLRLLGVDLDNLDSVAVEQD